jgi:hypothetical protein
MYRFITLFLILIIFTFFVSCSSGGGIENPSAPDSASSYIPVGVSDWGKDGSPSQGMGTLGLFELVIDKTGKSAELTPLRKSTLTDVLEVVDIINFLNLAPCSDCAKIKSISLDVDGNVVVSIGIKHPFDAGDPLKPVSGRNRADLHVFNVEGTVVSNADIRSFSAISESVAGFVLVNADGYSKYLDQVLDDIYPTDATIHPYITHFDDYSTGNFDPSNPTGFESVTTPGPSGNLVMPMGCDYDYKDYTLSFDNDSIDLIFAVGCTYAVSSASKLQRFSPEYRVPQHNKKAASEVWVEINDNQLGAGDNTSTADLAINVVDISHGVEVGTALDQMFADSSVGSISLEIPGIESSLVVVDTSSPTGTGHDPSDPLVYTTTITNTMSADIGTYEGLVKVVDTYNPGLNTSPLLNGMDGIKRVDPIVNPLTGLFEIDEFATYAIFKIDVALMNEPPVADLQPTGALISTGQTITWDATASSDPDGTIVLYEFDFDILDGDPLNFTADDSNTTGIMESDQYNTEGAFYAAVRVTDNNNATDIAVESFETSEFIPTYWTQYQHDPTHAGRTNVTGPQTNNVEWIYPGPGNNALNFMEGHDGSIYWGCVGNSGQIYAINPDGTEKWIYTPSISGSWNKPLGVSADDTVVYAGLETGFFDGRLVGINAATGAELWITPYKVYVSANTYGLILENGDIVVSCESSSYCTKRFDKDGNEIWNTPTDWNWCTAPAQGPDGTIYVKSSDNLYGLNPDTGAIEHQVYFGTGSLNTQACLAVRSDGSVVFQGNIMNDIRTWCFNADLVLQWQLDAGTGIPIDGFGIGPNDEIYFTVYGILYMIVPGGTLLDWQWLGGMNWTSPVVGADGTIYTGTTSGVAAINPDGSTKWSYNGPSYGCPILAHDGSLYVNMEGDIYKFNDL